MYFIGCKTASTYDELRDFVVLPSRRTLQNYWNAIKSNVGFNPPVIAKLKVNHLYFVHSHFLYLKFDATCGDYLIVWQNFWKFCFLFPTFFHELLHVFCSYVDRLWNNIILIFLNFWLINSNNLFLKKKSFPLSLFIYFSYFKT